VPKKQKRMNTKIAFDNERYPFGPRHPLKIDGFIDEISSILDGAAKCCVLLAHSKFCEIVFFCAHVICVIMRRHFIFPIWRTSTTFCYRVKKLCLVFVHVGSAVVCSSIDDFSPL
jgi:hypothetical protein